MKALLNEFERGGGALELGNDVGARFNA